MRFLGNLPFKDRLSQYFHTNPVIVDAIMTMIPTIPKIASYDHCEDFGLEVEAKSVQK